MFKTAQSIIEKVLSDIKAAGLWKTEREIASRQGVEITVNGKKVLNFCANNYLGLSGDARIEQFAHESLKEWGYGLSSVRFICGTQTIHKALEKKIAAFVGMDDAILYSSCFDANTGLFETILTEEDAIISDALNHASIIDGVRLCKAERRRYTHSDMADLEKQLQESQGKRMRMIATDGVFSMDGEIAKLPEIVALAEKYNALLMVDDSHATGVVGKGGRGTLDLTGVTGKVDILTSTFGKACGGATGGFTAARQPIVDLFRQRSRPYLFSNSLAPMIVATTMKTLDLVESMDADRARLTEHAKYFREQMTSLGFTIKPGQHPIIPVMFGDAVPAEEMAKGLLEEGIYVIGFWYPVVPQGQARIRVQLSAAHTREQVEQAIAAFTKIGKSLKII